VAARGAPRPRQGQAAALLERAGGNPRYLDEILRYATGVRGRALFEGRDPARPLTAAGLQELLARSVALVDLIAERLAASPDAVQQAVVLAALQGPEVLDATRAILERFVRLTQETHDDHVSLWGAALLARARVALGDHVADEEGPRAAIEQYAAGNAALAALGDEPFDEDALLAFRLVTDRIGWVLQEAGRLEDAEDRFRTVLGIVGQLEAIDPDYVHLRAHPLRRLGTCAFRRGDAERAANLFDQARVAQAAALGPASPLPARMTHVETLLALAEAHAATGDRATAVAWAREAHALATDAARESASPDVAALLAHAAELVAAWSGASP
jgi:tetratricopeptide (TPR) repeat protein